MASLFSSGKFQAFDAAGNPLAGGKVYTYAAGTLTPLASYTTQAGDVANANPVVLDSAGRASVWLGASSYRAVLKDSAGSTIWDTDNISPTAASSVTFTQSGTGAVVRNAQDKLRESISVLDFGADPTGVSDSAAAFALAFAVGGRIVIPAGTYKTSAASSLVSGTELIGLGLPTVTTTAADKHIISGVGLSNVSIRGVSFVGMGSSTVPTVSVGGYSATASGLVTLATCTNVTISDCSFTAFYNGVSALNCSDVDITRNRITNWLLYGVLASLSDRFTIDHNYIVGCDQTGAVNAYGVSATGDENGGNSQEACSISFNLIRGIPSWDGIMTHDVSGLRVIGNDIRDVRNGIDLGHVNSTNFVRDLIVSLNYVESTTTNSWGATPALHAGIFVTGYDATHLVDGVTIIGNEVKNFFQTAGMVGSGAPSHIVAQYCERAVVQGNRVRNGGSVVGASGIYVVGGNNGLVVSGNSVEGTFAPGGIRLAGVLADSATITGNTIKQASTGDRAVYITGSTITSLAVGSNATNSTVPFDQATSTLTMASNDIVGTFALSAAASSVISNVNVTAACTILLTPTSAAAATLQGSAKCLYISTRTAAASFTVSTANGVAAAGGGTETFAYRISF